VTQAATEHTETLDSSDRYELFEWSDTPLGMILAPIGLAMFAYIYVSIEHGVLNWSLCLVIGAVVAAIVSRVIFRVYARPYAVFEPGFLRVHRWRRRYEPRDKLIAYYDVGDISREGDSVVEVAYVGTSFFTRKPKKRYERFRTKDADAFVARLAQEVRATGFDPRITRN
jgi:hypothetical protein